MLKHSNATVHNLLPGCTDEIQVFDDGFGALIKHHAQEVSDEWLMVDANWKEWTSTSLSASRRRVLRRLRMWCPGIEGAEHGYVIGVDYAGPFDQDNDGNTYALFGVEVAHTNYGMVTLHIDRGSAGAVQGPRGPAGGLPPWGTRASGPGGPLHRPCMIIFCGYA